MKKKLLLIVFSAIMMITSYGQSPGTGAPDPICNQGDVISMFSNVYTDVPVSTWLTPWSPPATVLTDLQIAGNDTKLYENVSFFGVETTGPDLIDASSMTNFHIDVWTPNMTVLRVKLVDFGANGVFGGGDDSEFEITFDMPAQNEWVSIDIPLADFLGLTSTENLAQLIFSGEPFGGGTFYLDNVYYSNDNCPTAAPTPTCPSAEVISMFSNEYTDVPVTTWLTPWSPPATTLTDLQVSGNDTKLYENVSFFGVETTGPDLIDASAMTQFHIDIWTPNMTLYRIKLVDFGADGQFGGGDDSEHEITFNSPAQNEWVSYNIPLSSFTGLQSTEHLAQLIISGDPAGGGTLYIDNVYYSTCAPLQPTTADITFCVDLSCLPNPIAPSVFGTFNGFCANCNFLFDPDGDGVWCTTVTLNEGAGQEYLFFTQDQGPEVLAPGSTCTVTNSGFTNRVIDVVAGQDQTVTFGWESCNEVCTPPPPLPDLKLTFEDQATIDYALVGFGGLTPALVADPTDPANTVVRAFKPNGAATFAGFIVASAGMQNPIPFTVDEQIMSVRVWSPEAGTPILLKVENTQNPGINAEVLVNTTVGNDWETLFFDFSNSTLNLANEYTRVVLFPDFNNIGQGENYYFDDISMAYVTSISAVQDLMNCENDMIAADVTVAFSSVPATGTLELTGSATGSVDVSTLTGTSHVFSVLVPADNSVLSFTAFFSEEAGCTLTNANAGTTPNTCAAINPIISQTDEDGDGIDDINDPCSCGDPLNEVVNGVLYFHGFITIISGPGEVWTIEAINSGELLLSAGGTAFAVGDEIPEISAGVYQIDIWSEAGVGFNAGFNRDIAPLATPISTGGTCDDEVPPTATCQDITIQLDDLGSASATAGQINNGSTDDCTPDNLTFNLSQTNFDCSETGDNTVTLTVTDLRGNSSACTATVTVEDNIPPTLNCPSEIVVNLDPGACDAFVNWTVTATDNCPLVGLFFTNGFEGAYDPGNWFTSIDGDGAVNTAGAPGSVTLVGANDGTFGAETNLCIVMPTTGPITFTWNYSSANSSAFWDPFGYTVNGAFSQLTTTAGGLNQSGTVTINVNEGDEFCFSQRSVDGVFGAGTTVISGFSGPLLIDLQPIQIQGPPSGSVFERGSTTIGYEITDLSGNTSQCFFDVIVLEFPNPITSLVCNDTVTVALEGGDCMEVIGADIVLEGGPYGCYDDYIIEVYEENGTLLGDVVTSDQIGQVLTVTVTDPETGNFCETILLVEDNIAPTISCSDITVSCVDPTGPDQIEDADPVVFDACGDVTVSSEDEIVDGGCDDDFVAQIIRTWTATDESGNSNTCTQNITVQRPATTEIDFPVNLDDIDLPALSCENPNIDPSNTGFPTINGVEIMNNDLCGFNFLFEDLVVPICDGSDKILRTWILTNWCTGEIIEETQIIKILDKTGPSLNCPSNTFEYGTTSNSCSANILLPVIGVSDNCGDAANVSVTVETAFGDLNGNGGLLTNVPKGIHSATYIATDDCGNSSSCDISFEVIDYSAPVAICDEQTTVSLGQDGTANICWPTFDDGSYDNCEILAYKVKRMDDPNNVPFTDCVAFDCEDVGNTVMVRLRVYDIPGTFSENDPLGRFNECMVEVEVQDKLDPVLVCPPNKTVDCWQFDETEFDGVSATDHPSTLNTNPFDDTPWPRVIFNGVQIGFYPNATDNCDLDLSDPTNIINTVTVTITQNVNIDQCGEGSVTRIHTAQDNAGNTVSCVQIITIDNAEPFDICDTECWNTPVFGCNSHSLDDGVEWPCDIELDACGPGLSPDDLEDNPVVNEFDARPRIFEDACDLVGITFEDTELPITQNGCIKLIRKWIVVDWCQPDPSFPLGYKTWTYLQEIKVLESDAPVITSTCEDVTICGYDADCDPFPADLILTAMDDCTEDEDLNYFYKIDAFNDGVFDITTDNNPLFNPFNPAPDIGPAPGQDDFDASGEYPIGTHRISWKVEDGCGNITTCEYLFTIKDCKAPTPICINSITTVVMPNTGEITLEPLFFEDQSFSFYCTDFEDLLFSFSSDVNDTLFTVDCDLLQSDTVFQIELWVTDEAGNQDFCATSVEIQDPTGVCDPQAPTAVVAGMIQTEDLEGVGNAMVEISDGTNSPIASQTTLSSGSFNFDLSPFNNYTIEPGKNINPNNGVTTFDLVLISQHILGVDLLETPYQLIAADVSNDAAITTFDIVQLRQVILYITNEFPNNTSWRFVDQDYIFPDPANPFVPPYPEVININNLDQDMLGNDFVGVKIGDIDGSAIPNQLANDNTQNRTIDKDLVFAIEDQPLRSGNEVSVAFKASDFTNILGYQFTLNFDVNALEFIDVVPAQLSGLNVNNFGLAKLNEGVITTSWNADKVNRTDGDELFVFTFRVKDNVSLSEVIRVTSEYTKAEAYNTELEIMGVGLRFDNKEESQIIGGGFELYQNQPNPFRNETVIGFYLSESTKATLKIYTVAGEMLRVIEGDYAKGYNAISINKSDLPGNGILYYQLETPTNTATKKMITIE